MAWIADDTGTITISVVGEGFLEITNIETSHTTANPGTAITITVYFKNIGAITDNFYWEAIDTISGAELASNTIQGVSSGMAFHQDFGFTMPDRDITIQIKTYHQE